MDLLSKEKTYTLRVGNAGLRWATCELVTAIRVSLNGYGFVVTSAAGGLNVMEILKSSRNLGNDAVLDFFLDCCSHLRL